MFVEKCLLFPISLGGHSDLSSDNVVMEMTHVGITGEIFPLGWRAVPGPLLLDFTRFACLSASHQAQEASVFWTGPRSECFEFSLLFFCWGSFQPTTHSEATCEYVA